MKIVSFQNEGYLDLVSIVTFGVNAKESENPIGYFGTGLKYAVAVLLREGCDICIRTGDEHYAFSVLEKEIRGKRFSIVTINGEPAGFTNELGKNWNIWQAFRELYCNALDEGGRVEGGELPHEKALTTVKVSGEKFHEAYLNRESIVLSSVAHIEGAEAEIHKGESPYIFFKRVRVAEPVKRPMYVYNIKTGVDLSEDRTANYTFQLHRRIGSLIMMCHDREIIDSVLLNKNNFEKDIEFDECPMTVGGTFLDAVEDLRLEPDLNRTALKVLLRHRPAPPLKAIKLNEIQRQQLEKAILFCKEIGYPVDEYPVAVTRELKGGMMGLAEKGEIFLSLDVFGMGTKYVASTIIEEYLHLHTGYADCTRALQNHLFNDLVSLGEQVVGYPV